MRIRDGESYEEWAKRCQMYEHGYALQQIAEGQDVDTVLESMSKRLMEKLLHPIYKLMGDRDDAKIKALVNEGRKHYEEYYIKRIGPRADHVLDELVQTSKLHDAKDQGGT